MITINEDGSIYLDNGEAATQIFDSNQVYGIYLAMRDVWGTKVK